MARRVFVHPRPGRLRAQCAARLLLFSDCRKLIRPERTRFVSPIRPKGSLLFLWILSNHRSLRLRPPGAYNSFRAHHAQWVYQMRKRILCGSNWINEQGCRNCRSASGGCREPRPTLVTPSEDGSRKLLAVLHRRERASTPTRQVDEPHLTLANGLL